jgi:hypothetical protein
MSNRYGKYRPYLMRQSNGSFTAYLKNHAATFVVVTTAAVVIAYAALTADALSLLHPSGKLPLRGFFLAVFWSSPVFFVLQVCALLLLTWQVVYRKGVIIPGARPVGRWLLLLGVSAAPIVMLTVSVIFVGAYQEQYGHWFFYTNDGLAGLILLPFYVVGSAIVARGLSQPGFRLKSGVHFVVLLTLISVCVWYVFATAVLNMATDASMDLRLAAIVPGVAAANYVLLAIDIKRRGLIESAHKPSIVMWFSAMAVTLAVKIPLAMRLFAALPVERPNGYGDCFVVSAAAQGHPRFVCSRFDAAVGRPVNKQLHTLRTFEDALAQYQPITHRRLRLIYDRVGPPVAACIRSPFVADVMYLVLKPAEWLANLYLFAKTERNGRE